MKPPIRRLTKKDIEWLNDHLCRAHGHSYLSHYPCMLRESPADSPFKEKVGYLDIESTGLKGNWDYMLCYSLKPEGEKKILGRHLEPEEITGCVFDKKLTAELIADVRKFDRVVTYYGTKFDIPFIKTRAEKWGLDFPSYRDLWATDIYYIAKVNLLLHSTRLQHVCALLGIPSKQHPLDPDLWQRAQSGHLPSLKIVKIHCDEDVIASDKAHQRLKKYTIPTKRSI